MAVRLDSIQQMDPGAADPIGTKAEVKSLGLPLVKYATCSLPGRRNRGCQYYEHEVLGPCPIRALLASRGRPGPEMVAYVTMKSPTNWKQDATHCYTYMSHLHTVDPKLALNKVIGIGGDKVIRRRTTEPVDPKNPRGGAAKVVFVNEPVLPLPRPNVSMAERVEAITMAEDIRKEQAGIPPAAIDIPDEPDEEIGSDLTDEELELEGGDLDDEPEGGAPMPLKVAGEDLSALDD